MFRNFIDLTSTIIGLENVLRIEYKDPNCEEVVKRAVRGIENTHRVSINGDIYKATTEYSTVAGSILDSFMASLTECLKSMALINCITLFDNRVGMTLRDVNYLGSAKEQMVKALKYLQHYSLYEDRVSFMDALIANTSNLEHNEIRRLLTIMFVLERIGCKEGVSIIAQYLYLGIAL